MKSLTLKALIAVSAILVIGGCNVDNSSNLEKNNAIYYAGSTVSVYDGDTVTPLDDTTEVEISHFYGDDYKSITVLSGSIKVVRN